MRNYFNLKDRIMQQVYVIWFLRKMLPILVLEVVSLGFVVWLVDTFVSFGNVLGNFSDISRSGVLALARFMVESLAFTKAITLVILVGGVALSLMLARNIFKSFQIFSARRQSIFTT